ncbi:arsenic resistance N-acetyltransferase ArsN2 [Mucilaginibacter sp. AW1-3]
MQIEKGTFYKKAMLDLLKAEGLPADDLRDGPDDFFVAISNNEVIACAGLEVYGNYGLLRSLAVNRSFRNNGIGDELLRKIESTAKTKELLSIFLLTETAPDYFKRKHYQQIARADIPVEVQASSEFSHVCPVSAIAMKKELK